MSELRILRTQLHLSQREAAAKIGILLRSYIDYENDERKVGTAKYRFLLRELENAFMLDEEHGLLSQADIRRVCGEILPEYGVAFCYLFGSYAKGTASETSDVDLLISAGVSGLAFFELAERLRTTLHKRVDLLDVKQLSGNAELLGEILKDGIKIYG